MLEFDDEGIDKSFLQIDAASKNNFLPFQFSNYFPDTTFSMLYAWNKEFNYTYRCIGNTIAVAGTDRDGTVCCMLLGADRNLNLENIISELYQTFQSSKKTLILKYISEEQLPAFEAAAKKLNVKTTLFHDEKYSDYIYETKEFIAMNGNKNKGKRGGYNYLLHCFPDVECRYYIADMYEDIMHIFDLWCDRHDCEKCYYGCEKRAFERFMEIYDVSRHTIAVAYSGIEPLSFAVSEKINSDMVCYYFQKNAIRQRGLTYWLNREMAMRHQKIRYINLGEDMGIEGLKMDKTNLHPCKKNHKYQILFSNREN